MKKEQNLKSKKKVHGKRDDGSAVQDILNKLAQPVDRQIAVARNAKIKREKQETVTDRKVATNQLTHSERLEVLDARLGAGVGAKRERARLR